MHPQNVTVWCAFWVGFVIDPYFFQYDIGEAITVNDKPYRTMITDFFRAKLNDMDVNDIAKATMDTFEAMVISPKGGVNWPPKSCDLTFLDFFLCSFLKSLVYVNKTSY